ncbi:MAG: glycosyltransferase [Hydrogenophaga sp.]|uniref:glycosyltransferase n=1 Tax=Hydrogenophaga sp. TaxID=1904254 RepID=UPI0027281C04|nr:glycosyltransferase [Hydrogenophaga sp.]MDO9148498.1 glycosyltransferase [Hydrogenophaga sp.]MDO9605219.1 glycosyltransferase [Hydrogenophaga sp.]
MRPSATLCLTIGNRPEQLRQTLTSLLGHIAFDEVIAVNDFGDEPTNSVFRELCPSGTLIVQERQMGHHIAADAMYERITTPYVFHCEDDWVFETAPDLSGAQALLQDSRASMVCFRAVEDVLHDKPMNFKPARHEFNGQKAWRLDHLHKQWHGFTFNPHFGALSLWKELGGFSRYAAEKDISAAIRAQGRVVVYADPGACRHIGDGVSVSGTNRKSLSKHVKAWIRSKRDRA